MYHELKILCILGISEILQNIVTFLTPDAVEVERWTTELKFANYEGRLLPNTWWLSHVDHLTCEIKEMSFAQIPQKISFCMLKLSIYADLPKRYSIILCYHFSFFSWTKRLWVTACDEADDKPVLDCFHMCCLPCTSSVNPNVVHHGYKGLSQGWNTWDLSEIPPASVVTHGDHPLALAAWDQKDKDFHCVTGAISPGRENGLAAGHLSYNTISYYQKIIVMWLGNLCLEVAYHIWFSGSEHPEVYGSSITNPQMMV